MCIRLYVFTLFGVVIALNHKKDRKHINHEAHLSEIPKQFELHGNNPEIQFRKYALDINSIALRENLTVTYNVKVHAGKPGKHVSKKMKKFRSKTYNVPLKKTIKKMSSREVLMRRLAEAREHKSEKPIVMSTHKQQIIYTTKPPHSGKYKPIISSVRTNYTKKIKPVRSKIFIMKS